MQKTQKEMNCSNTSQMAVLNDDDVIQSLQIQTEGKVNKLKDTQHF
jgi:hypothetical protein